MFRSISINNELCDHQIDFLLCCFLFKINYYYVFDSTKVYSSSECMIQTKIDEYKLGINTRLTPLVQSETVVSCHCRNNLSQAVKMDAFPKSGTSKQSSK